MAPGSEDGGRNDATGAPFMEPMPDPADDFDMRWDGTTITIEHWHFHRRLLERYGIVLAPGEFSRMVASLRSGKALLVERRKGDTAVYYVPIKRLYERVYVLSDGKRLITVLLPNRGLNEKRRRLRAEARRGSTAPSLRDTAQITTVMPLL